MQDSCSTGGDREDEFDVGRKRGREALQEVRPSVVSNVIKANED